MNRIFTAILAGCLWASASARADSFLGYSFPVTGTKWPFPTGSCRIGLQSGLGMIGFPSFGSRDAFLPLMVTADFSTSPHWAVGFYAGRYKATYTDEYLAEQFSSHLVSYAYGGRFTLHFADVLNRHFGAGIPVKLWDIYSTAHIGFMTRDWDVDSRFRDVRAEFDKTHYPSLGLVVGARYMAHPMVSLHAEVGKGPFGFIAFGLSGRIW
jgi:hypothetical protein